jgi:hypothetical protein
MIALLDDINDPADITNVLGLSFLLLSRFELADSLLGFVADLPRQPHATA